MRFDKQAIFVKKGKEKLVNGKIKRDNITETYDVSERQVPFELQPIILGTQGEDSVMLVVHFDVPYYDEVIYLGETYNIKDMYKFKHKTGFILGDRLHD